MWTSDHEHGLDIARRMNVGTFGVNLYVPDLGAPWATRKASGLGSMYGPEGLNAYCRPNPYFCPHRSEGDQ